jgi:hypothetical protein
MKGTMADYFTNFSLVITLKDKEQREYALDLAGKAVQYRSDETPVPDGFPTNLVEYLEDWDFETEQEKDGIWLHSQNGGINAVCAFIQHLLQKFDPISQVSFEWSYDCTKPRTDAYGGGAAYIAANEIQTFSTSDWLSSNSC